MTHVRALTPFVHVADVRRSIAWYEALGLQLERTWAPTEGEDPAWAFLEVEEARIMLARASAPIDPAEQAVLFYLWADDLDALSRALVAKGLEPGPIEDGSPGPARELRLTDPDGYVVVVGEVEREPAGA